MKKNFSYACFVVILMLRIFYQPSQTRNNIRPFTSPSPLPASTISVVPAMPGNINAGSNERLILKWIIGDNRAGLCFISPVPVNEFYEIAGNPFVSGRIN